MSAKRYPIVEQYKDGKNHEVYVMYSKRVRPFDRKILYASTTNARSDLMFTNTIHITWMHDENQWRIREKRTYDNGKVEYYEEYGREVHRNRKGLHCHMGNIEFMFKYTFCEYRRRARIATKTWPLIGEQLLNQKIKERGILEQIKQYLFIDNNPRPSKRRRIKD